MDRNPTHINVLLTREGQAKLSDLGIARTFDATRHVTTATDVYSLGLLLLEACTVR